MNTKTETTPVVEKSEVALREEAIQTFWEEHDIFKKSIETPAGSEPVGDFVFYDSGTSAIFRPKLIEEDKHYTAEIFNKELSFFVESPEEEKEKKKKNNQEKEAAKQNIQLNSGVKSIDINLSTQKMNTAQGGKAISEYLISSGAPGMSTPVGTFYIQTKELNHWSTTYGLYMPYAMRIHGAYYIHELPYWPGGYREGEDHLGTPVSHGCVRLGMGSAKQVYNFANIGTKVLIHY